MLISANRPRNNKQLQFRKRALTLIFVALGQGDEHGKHDWEPHGCSCCSRGWFTWGYHFPNSPSRCERRRDKRLLMPIAIRDWVFIGRCLRMRPKGDGGASFVSHCGQDDIFDDTTPSWLSEVDARMGRRGGNRGAAPISRGRHVTIFPEKLSPSPRVPRDERILTTVVRSSPSPPRGA